MDPLISVIIPTYNRSNLVCEATDSVLNQTYKNYEIIVVDDGSTDNTKRVLEKYDSKVRYIYQNNKGCAEARNVGIKIAKGKYIAFLDSDDIWLPKKLELQMEFFNNNCYAEFLYTNGFIQDLQKYDMKPYYNDTFKPSAGNVLPKLFLGNFIITSSVILKKELFDKAGYFDELIIKCEDYNMWLRLACLCNFDYLDHPLTIYRIHPNRESRNYKEDFRYLNRLKTFKAILKIHPQLEKEIETTAVKKRIAGQYYELARVYAEQNKLKEAKRNILSSIQISPFSIKKYILLFMFLLKLFPLIQRNKIIQDFLFGNNEHPNS